jgi:hypothetical protein
MLNIKELRLDNLVQLEKTNDICIVNSIHDYGTIKLTPINRQALDWKRESFNVIETLDLKPIKLTKEFILKFDKVEQIKTFTVLPSFIINLTRRRRLAISVEPGNTYIYLQEYDENDYRKVLDLVCLFNSDYDGELYVHYLQNLYFSLTKQDLNLL